MIIAITIILVLIVVFVLIWTSGDDTDKKESERLRMEYESALHGSDRKAALKAGRLYYAIGRKDRTLTIYDELAISNDLSTMTQEMYLPKPEKTETSDIEIIERPTSTIVTY